MENSTHLSLPYILPAQAQKHVTHNEAVCLLDTLVHLSVKSRTFATPPSAPQEGDRYILPAQSLGNWSGHDGGIAAWQDNIWTHLTPQNGWQAWCEEEQTLLVYNDSIWVEPYTPQDVQNTENSGSTHKPIQQTVLASKQTLFYFLMMMSHWGVGTLEFLLTKVLRARQQALYFKNTIQPMQNLDLPEAMILKLKQAQTGRRFRMRLKSTIKPGKLLSLKGRQDPRNSLAFPTAA